MKFADGYKTAIAAVSMLLLGIYDIINTEDPDVNAGVLKITTALGMIGIGRKLDKAAK